MRQVLFPKLTAAIPNAEIKSGRLLMLLSITESVAHAVQQMNLTTIQRLTTMNVQLLQNVVHLSGFALALVFFLLESFLFTPVAPTVENFCLRRCSVV